MIHKNWNFCKDLFDDKNYEEAFNKDQIEEKYERSLFAKDKIKNLAQANRHNVKKIRKDLKAMLPMIPFVEVKRFYLKYNEALIDELKEDGLKEAADFIQKLIEFNEEKRNIAGPDTSIWVKPRLMDQRDLLDNLKEALIAIESAKKNEQWIEVSNYWIKISIFFQSKGEDWWWITKTLYQNALKAAESIEEDNGYNITAIRYLYGRFLFMIDAEWLKALEYLDIARKASEERIWNVSNILGENEQTIFKESCALICKILLTLVQRIGEEDSEFAINACNEALQRAMDTGHYDYIANALYELGRIHLHYGYVKEALQEFSKLLAMAKRIPDPNGICNAHMELAFAYKMKPNLATSHLENAFTLYYDLGSIKEADQARFITGISRGQEQIEQFIDLVLECGKHNPYALLKMCAWKSNRNVFWADKQRDIDTDYHHEYCEYFTYPSSSILNNSTKENVENQ